jgi:uncharacterized protein DUF6817
MFATYEDAHRAAKDRFVAMYESKPQTATLSDARRLAAEAAGFSGWDELVDDCRARYSGPVKEGPSAAELAALERLQTELKNHSGGSLFDHLVGTREYLAEFGNEPAVCTAGLFHSIYGTEYYRVQSESLDNRVELAGVIGEFAEHLAFLFCVTDRTGFVAAARSSGPRLQNRLDGTELTLERDTARALVEIEVANVVEQAHPRYLGDDSRTFVRKLAADVEGLVSPGALACLRRLVSRLESTA